MSFFKWFSGFFGAMSDHEGWQYSQPTSSAVTNSKTYSPDQGMQVSTVWACIDLLSRSIASLPVRVYLVKPDGGKEVDTKCNLHYITSVSPNYAMTPYEFWQTMVMHWALRGNAYALIVRKEDKTVKALYPLNPDQMEVFQDSNGKIIYQYYDRHSNIVQYAPEDMLHWKCIGNGLIGLSKLDYMRASISESALTQETAVDMYKNKGKVNGILSASGATNITQRREIAKAFASRDESGGNIAVLPMGVSFQQLALSPADSQLLETRKFTVEELCRWFSVPPALINTDGGAAGSNIEQVTANFYKNTILPICRSLEQVIMKRLPCVDEKYNHEVNFYLPFLLRANDKDRYAMNAQALQNGWKTRNEVRIEENLPPVPGGDDLTCQSNLVPIDKLGVTDASQVSQTPLTTEPIQQ